MKPGYVYILASSRNGTLYTGVTSNLENRLAEHRSNKYEGFTSQYAVYTLVYFEFCESILSAIQREKNIKNWKRDWKMQLIEAHNPQWKDLSESF
jgi:putative endonuclease